MEATPGGDNGSPERLERFMKSMHVTAARAPPANAQVGASARVCLLFRCHALPGRISADPAPLSFCAGLFLAPPSLRQWQPRRSTTLPLWMPSAPKPMRSSSTHSFLSVPFFLPLSLSLSLSTFRPPPPLYTTPLLSSVPFSAPSLALTHLATRLQLRRHPPLPLRAPERPLFSPPTLFQHARHPSRSSFLPFHLFSAISLKFLFFFFDTVNTFFVSLFSLFHLFPLIFSYFLLAFLLVFSPPPFSFVIFAYIRVFYCLFVYSKLHRAALRARAIPSVS